MSRFRYLGVLAIVVFSAGCVSSGQYLEMRAKYEEEHDRANRLERESLAMERALRAANIDTGTRKKIIEVESGAPSSVPFAPSKDYTALRGGGARLEELHFRSGSAELSEKGKAALDSIGEQLKGMPPVAVVVDGHTDTDPILKSHHASNWELSGKRAAAVLDYLVKKGAVDPKNAALRGYGEFRPLPPPAGKAQNRRVEIFAIRTPGAGGVPAKVGGAEEPVTPARPTPKPAPKTAPKEPALDDPSYK